MRLDERKRLILRAVVEDYVISAEPVGSQSLRQRYHLNVSPATIRHEMADLEAYGFLEQPYTSAGRVPSDKGYRLYVDRLMQRRALPPELVDRIRDTYQRRVIGVQWLVQQTVRLISEMTDYMAVALGPDLTTSKIESLSALPVGDTQVLLVLVTDGGYVQHRMVMLPDGLTPMEVCTAVAVLSQRLRNLSLDGLGRSAMASIADALHSRRQLLDQVMDFLIEALRPSDEDRVVLGGTKQMLSQPEFQDVDRLRMLLGMLEGGRLVEDALLAESAAGGVRVVIGAEHRLDDLRDMSLVTAAIAQDDQVLVRFGVLGPRRMDYPKVVAVIEEIARQTTFVL